MTDYACKDAICSPGEYASLPLWLLARADVRPAAKLVALALLDRLRGSAVWTAAPLAALAAATGLCRRKVQQALGELAAGEVVHLRRVVGRPAEVAFYLPPDPRTECAGGGRTECAGGAHGMRGTRARNAPPRTPLLHSRAHSRARAGARGHSDDHDAQPALPFDQAARQRATDAYREVFSSLPPFSWWRRWELEASGGDPGLLEALDAAAIRRGMALAKTRRWTFGLGAVLAAIQEKRLSSASEPRANEPRLQGSGAVPDAAAEARAAQAHEREILDHWQSLDPAARREHLDRVTARPGPRLPARLAELVAAQEAWNQSRADSGVAR